MHKWRFSFVTFLILVAAVPVFAGSGAFSNPAPITIPDFGAGSPFPSSITVSGLTGPILDVNVSVIGLSHTWPGDVQLVLVGPGGRAVTLLSAPTTGWNVDAVNATITFDDQAAAVIAPPVVSGTFRPTQATSPFDLASAGGPALPYGTALSDYNGANPNGTWRLYVYDDANLDAGTIAGGWSVAITTAEPGESVVMTCYPPLTANAVVGSLPLDAQVFYEPGNLSPDLFLSAGTYHVLGVDESGEYYAVVLGCDRLWVPVASMTPNTNPDDAMWYGVPLPTNIVAS